MSVLLKEIYRFYETPIKYQRPFIFQKHRVILLNVIWKLKTTPTKKLKIRRKKAQWHYGPQLETMLLIRVIKIV